MRIELLADINGQECLFRHTRQVSRFSVELLEVELLEIVYRALPAAVRKRSGRVCVSRFLASGLATHLIRLYLKAFIIGRKSYTMQELHEPRVRAKMVKNRPYL